METLKIPMIPMRDLVIFPKSVTHFDCGREISINAVENAELHDSKIFLASQKDSMVKEPKIEDIYKYGTIAEVKQILKVPGGIVRVLVEGIERARMISLNEEDGYLQAEIEVFEEEEVSEGNKDIEAALRLVESDIYSYGELDDRLIPGLLQSAVDSSTPARLVDTACSYLNLKLKDSQKILESVDVYERLVNFHAIMKREIEVLSIEKNIDNQVKTKMNKIQREYYLKEQLKIIHKELGDDEEEEETISKYKRLIKEKNLPDEVREKALKEVKKLENTNSMSPEYSVGVNYLDWNLELPWMEVKKT